MPLIAPRNVGLRCLLAKMSQSTQVSRETAVVGLVLMSANDASAPEKYRSPALNPLPTQPQDPGTDRGQRKVVRDGAVAVTRQPRTDHRGRHESGCPGGEVDHVATAVVQGTSL